VSHKCGKPYYAPQLVEKGLSQREGFGVWGKREIYIVSGKRDGRGVGV